jgi:hypothetical protein
MNISHDALADNFFLSDAFFNVHYAICACRPECGIGT